jgi:hypothetical protein
VAGLPAAAAAEFSDGHWGSKPLHDVARVPPQQALIGPREAVLRKVADHFKQRGTNIVIQVFRREFLLAWLGEAGAHVGCEFISRARGDGLNQHIGDSLVDQNLEIDEVTISGLHSEIRCR